MSKHEIGIVICLHSRALTAQVDAGVRPGPAGAPNAGMTAGEQDFFTNHAVPTFNEVEAVGDRLGPRFNLNSCAGCHAQSVRSSPATNPQVAEASSMAPGNTVPAFLKPNGPVREVRFIHNPDIQQNLASDPQGRKAFFGIQGHVNTSGNDGTVKRFGWKAQNKSLLIFAGEAYQHRDGRDQ